MTDLRSSTTRGTSKVVAVFRLIFGLFFVGFGLSQYGGHPSALLPYLIFGLGLLFLAYGLAGLWAGRIGPAAPPATDKTQTRLTAAGTAATSKRKPS